jgi:hypothetical protein
MTTKTRSVAIVLSLFAGSLAGSRAEAMPEWDPNDPSPLAPDEEPAPIPPPDANEGIGIGDNDNGDDSGWVPPDDAFYCVEPYCESPCDFLSFGDFLACVGCAGSPSVGSCASCTSGMIAAATCHQGFGQCLYERLPDPPTETECCTAADPPTCSPCCYSPPNYAERFEAACSFCQNLYD